MLELPDDDLALAVVDRDGRAQQLGVVLVLARDPDERRDVLAEAAPAPADPGVEEPHADALVETDAAHDLGDVGADALAHVRDLVREADLGREERVRRVLDHLGARQIRDDERHGAEALGPRRDVGRRRELLREDRLVERAKDVDGAAVGRADHDAVRVERVVDRRALAKELGVRGDDELAAPSGLAVEPARAAGTAAVRLVPSLEHEHLDPVAAADRHGRLVDDDPERAVGLRVERLTDRAGDLLDVAKVGRAVRLGRRADRDEDDLGGARARDVGREAKPPGRDAVAQQIVEPWLVDGRAPLGEGFDLRLVDVDARHMVAEKRQAYAGDEPDIARSDDTDLNWLGHNNSSQ